MRLKRIYATRNREKPHVVAAVIFNDKGEVLIAKRPLDKDMGGLWSFPVER